MIGIPFINVDRWLAFWALLNRSWFQRAWVVQEVAVAKTVTFLVGIFAFSFDVMTIAMFILRQSRWLEQLSKLSTKHLKGKGSFFINRANISLVRTKDVQIYEPNQETIFSVSFFENIFHLRCSHGITSKFWTRFGELQGPPPLETLIDVSLYKSHGPPRQDICILGLVWGWCE
jgi:hypothetical protein